jgi:hypothetical protein
MKKQNILMMTFFERIPAVNDKKIAVIGKKVYNESQWSGYKFTIPEPAHMPQESAIHDGNAVTENQEEKPGKQYFIFDNNRLVDEGIFLIC